ncbi:MAG: DUF1499 domain-containing protein [Gammaproteobacteria bacterium]|nr:DUF1499 domain-containing protein [Gammaproteobacteria bacterium]
MELALGKKRHFFDRRSASFQRRPRAKALTLLTVVGALASCTAVAPSSPAPRWVEAPEALAPCPLAPPCLVSRGDAGRAYVEPLAFSGSLEDALARLERLIAIDPQLTLEARGPGYLKVVAQTPLMGYQDDVEILRLGPGLLGLRSASRIGLFAGGTHGQRLAALRAAFGASAPAAP